MRMGKTQKIVFSAMFLAIAYVMPFLTGQIPEIGAMLCPLHIPVLLCGFVCGAPWGAAVGFVAPLFRSLTLGMPPLFPTALCMAFELATYGAVVGWMRRALPRTKPNIYLSLLVAMLVGRAVWGCAMFVCLGAAADRFTFAAFVAGAFTNAIPGILLQMTAVPILVMLLESRKMLHPKEY